MTEDASLAGHEGELRRAVRDLVALSTLPALWAGHDTDGIAASLGDVLVKILGLDLVYVRVEGSHGKPIELCRGSVGEAMEARVVGESLGPWIAGDSQTPAVLEASDGTPLRLALARFGHSGDHGVVVGGSRREGFPGRTERVLLGVGANQAATVLQRKRNEEALQRQNRALDTLVRFSSEVAGERDLESIVQTVVNAGRELTAAAFGAFFYNVVGATDDTYMLYALSGARREDFAGYPMPRSTGLFGPTFRGEGTIRISDVRRDFRYGSMPPHHGLPPGHLPVRSYLATPVASRSGEVIGGLFFGHPEPGVFRVESERVVEGLAAHAAIAIDNARLYRALKVELAEREGVEQALRDQAERKDRFLAVLGHELRNPLAPIRNCLEILERSEADPERGRQARRIMERQLVHLNRLVDDLLDVSRISRDKVRLRKESLDLVRLVRDTVEDHRPAMEEARLELDVALPEEPLWLEADRVRLVQSLGNLLENACKFSFPGGQVRVRVGREGREAVVSVADDGAGISPEDLPHIFEPFSQATVEQGRPGGLGLGLAVVKRLVELHGGRIQAFSEGLERGAELVVRLALLEDQPVLVRATQDEVPPVAPDHRVLLIEDNPDSAEALGELLRLHGHRVESAGDGEQGIAKAREFRPDVVLCDIGLPGEMDGYEVARSIRCDPSVSGTFLVALTGFGGEADRRRARKAGFDAHLTKPADPSTLQRLLAERRPAGRGETG